MWMLFRFDFDLSLGHFIKFIVDTDLAFGQTQRCSSAPFDICTIDQKPPILVVVLIDFIFCSIIITLWSAWPIIGS
jgi:hypothetical protein